MPSAQPVPRAFPFADPTADHVSTSPRSASTSWPSFGRFRLTALIPTHERQNRKHGATACTAHRDLALRSALLRIFPVPGHANQHLVVVNSNRIRFDPELGVIGPRPRLQIEPPRVAGTNNRSLVHIACRQGSTSMGATVVDRKKPFSHPKDRDHAPVDANCPSPAIRELRHGTNPVKLVVRVAHLRPIGIRVRYHTNVRRRSRYSRVLFGPGSVLPDSFRTQPRCELVTRRTGAQHAQEHGEGKVKKR